MCKQFSNFSRGMSKQMRKIFEFVNVDGMFHEITNTVVSCDYNMVMLMAT
jgi:hypothetical protein